MVMKNEEQIQFKEVYIDSETGDRYESASALFDVLEARKQEREEQKNHEFIQLSKGFAPHLLQNVSKTGLSILGFFLDNMQMQDLNTIMVSQTVLSEELNVTRQAVGNGIKSLKDNKIIGIGKIGQSNVYLINPRFAWMNGNKKRTTMRLNAQAILGKTENEKLFKEFEEIEYKSLRSENAIKGRLNIMNQIEKESQKNEGM